MADRAAKDALFAAFASVAAALGSGRRAEIVDVLAQRECSVEELAGEIEQSISNTSQHLQRLARAGLVRSRRSGHEVRYRLASDHVGELWSALRGVAAEHVAEVEVLARAYLGDPTGVERVCAEELAERLADGRVVVLDVRPSAEHAAGHIAGRPRDRGVLPRAVLRLCRRRRSPAAPSWAGRATSRRRLSRVAARRPSRPAANAGRVVKESPCCSARSSTTPPRAPATCSAVSRTRPWP
jgi:DNA-binding transcriptional ArsR family regulator